MRVERTRRRGQRRCKSAHDLLVEQIVAYLGVALPRGAFFTVLAMGGGRNFIRGPSLESQGVKRGLPDVLVLYERRAYAMEAKAGRDTLSGYQRDTHAAFQDALVPIAVVRSVDDVRRFLSGDCGLYLRGVLQ